jgi:hypothetical protein
MQGALMLLVEISKQLKGGCIEFIETFVLICCQFGGAAHFFLSGNRYINQLERFVVNGVWSKSLVWSNLLSYLRN